MRSESYVGAHICFFCGRTMTVRDTYLLAEKPTSDIVRSVCRHCYLRKSLEIRQAVAQERDEGFIR
ncbi:MAG: hypothetical protein C3F12_08805 [Candidatus Methylomirabilota bacterium]|nr:MAG: hypothetical protein C3F12_08805 [candidate division NC10 bacterium]